MTSEEKAATIARQVPNKLGLTNNLWLKVAALLLGMALILHATARDTSEKTLDVPVLWEGIDPRVEPVRPLPRRVSVRFRGSKRSLRALESALPVMRIDLSHAPWGVAYHRFFSINDLALSGDLKVTAVQVAKPRGVTVELRPVRGGAGAGSPH